MTPERIWIDPQTLQGYMEAFKGWGEEQYIRLDLHNAALAAKDETIRQLRDALTEISDREYQESQELARLKAEVEYLKHELCGSDETPNPFDFPDPKGEQG
jgi:hypothetical protein